MREASGGILVTGASGFVGRHLCAALAQTFPERSLVGTSNSAEPPAWAADIGMSWAPMDVRYPTQVRELMGQIKPALVYHLAALSHVPTAFKQPAETWTTNTLGTLHLLEAVRAQAEATALVYISSGDTYGRSFAPGADLDEDALLRPANPYAASKAAADLMVQEYGVRGTHTVCLRPFNHIGPGQRADFVVASFAQQIARIERGLQAPVITVGNLDAWRDFTDVRDIVRAYTSVGAGVGEIESGSVFNVCSGRPHQIRSVLDDLLKLTDAEIEIAVNPEHLRPSDTPYAAGNAGRLRAAVGWEPRIVWEQTLRDVLNDWRERAGQGLAD